MSAKLASNFKIKHLQVNIQIVKWGSLLSCLALVSIELWVVSSEYML